ncbi:MAG: tRNA (adenosine(37)-N6)-threonylcarbamoyltransferase complex transferase subunit TsaD [Candidatus Cloacimonadaceae bacterium]
MKDEFILAIESSCDDTSIALVNTNYDIIFQLTSSQSEHIRFGGVLPELASRLHMKNIVYLIETVINQTGLSLSEVSAIAVSINPGLIGSLIVGLSFAKSLAWGLGIPLITVNHMLGHLFANNIEHGYTHPPYLALIVSGGHTELVYFTTDTEFEYVGKTLDDAAGESFDKLAKLMGLGFPGGPIIDKLALDGNPEFIEFPLGLKQKDNFNFSYSGLKTSVIQFFNKQSSEWIEEHKNDLAASIQKAIVIPLVKKTIRYAKLHKIKTVLIGGGVAANSLLRKLMQEEAQRIGTKVYYPSVKLCMDNAAMIAAAAIPKYKNKIFASLDINAFSDKGTRYL